MFYNDTYLLPKWDCFPCYMVSYGTLCRIWQNKPAPQCTSVTRVFKLSPAKFVTWCQNLIPWWKFVEPDDKLLHPMIKKVQHGTSGYTILSLGIFFIGLCNFSTRLQIPRVPIWNTGLHSYRRRGPAWSVISWWTILDDEGGGLTPNPYNTFYSKACFAWTAAWWDWDWTSSQDQASTPGSSKRIVVC